ncbi:unnamed protein product [Mycena citricolor]|nr:unnamed protein product [Mycena citricolor]
MTVTLGGGKLALMHKWDVKDAVKIIRQERLTAAGGVPTMAVELVESDLVGYPLEAISFGGAPTPHLFPARARSVFANVNLIHGYGMTESNSLAASIAGEDCPAHPTSCGLGLPVTEIRIVEDGKVLASGQVGEIWIRGPNVMQGYWLDPEATDKVVTKDGWLMSGDSGYMDEEGFLYLRDRIKDIIIRGGENINSITVENALFTDGVLEAVAVGIPDNRLGELVAAVVSVKASERHRITESVLIELARSRLPSFAVPVMVLVQDELPHNQAGKPLKKIIREAAAQEWQKRGGKTVSKL